ncbi:MAG: HAMP domain-containing histidine kinase [Ruminococcaceae bacterium]|nr:HAMP domain-containing histidine kinase [Oscillospiraceae bacterium]
MIKRLRAVFITVTMSMVAVMLALIFFTVFQSTYYDLANHNLQVLQDLDKESFRAPWPDFPEPLPANCFILTLTVEGNIKVTAGYDAIPDPVMQHKLLEMAQQTRDKTGTFYEQGLRFYRMEDPKNISFAFLDVSKEISTMRTLVINCGLICIITLLMCLPVCWMLARAITKPVVTSMKQQQQFLADASHELKTPLTVILTNAELLQCDDFTFAEKEQFARDIHSVARQMRSLVEDMLHLARMEQSTPPEYMEPVCISDLAEECSMLFAPLYYESGRQLHFVADPELWIWGNPAKLQQLIDILLDNANKYSSPGSRVVLRLDRMGGNHCQLSVTSRGKPLSNQQSRDIFKRFYRVDASRTGSGSSGSYGLGLPIALQIAKEHRGKLWCVGKDGSNTFYAVFPLNTH